MQCIYETSWQYLATEDFSADQIGQRLTTPVGICHNFTSAYGGPFPRVTKGARPWLKGVQLGLKECHIHRRQKHPNPGLALITKDIGVPGIVAKRVNL